MVQSENKRKIDCTQYSQRCAMHINSKNTYYIRKQRNTYTYTLNTERKRREREKWKERKKIHPKMNHIAALVCANNFVCRIYVFVKRKNVVETKLANRLKLNSQWNFLSVKFSGEMQRNSTNMFNIHKLNHQLCFFRVCACGLW